jgi:hypothetical protein
MSITLSVAAQAVVFVLVGAMADYGGMRKKLLLWASVLGAVSSILCAGIDKGSWWTGMPLMLLSNVSLGLTSVMYNAYLPLLVQSSKEVTEAAPERRLDAELKRSNELSSKGFAWGFAAGVISILLCVPWAFLLSEIGSYQVAMVITGVWWFVFMYKPWKYLKVRWTAPRMSHSVRCINTDAFLGFCTILSLPALPPSPCCFLSVPTGAPRAALARGTELRGRIHKERPDHDSRSVIRVRIRSWFYECICCAKHTNTLLADLVSNLLQLFFRHRFFSRACRHSPAPDFDVVPDLLDGLFGRSVRYRNHRRPLCQQRSGMGMLQKGHWDPSHVPPRAHFRGPGEHRVSPRVPAIRFLS